jgi:hypothetical protein
MPRLRIAFIGAALMVAIVFSVQYWQRDNFDRTRELILNLTAADVTYLAVYRDQFATGTPIKIEGRKEIEAFLQGFRESEPYSPNHESTLQHISVRIVPQEIHLVLSQIERFDGAIFGDIGEFRSGQSYTHYGSFVSEGLYDWHKRHYSSAQDSDSGGS